MKTYREQGQNQSTPISIVKKLFDRVELTSKFRKRVMRKRGLGFGSASAERVIRKNRKTLLEMFELFSMKYFSISALDKGNPSKPKSQSSVNLKPEKLDLKEKEKSNKKVKSKDNNQKPL
jgi:hypothetical protein